MKPVGISVDEVDGAAKSAATYKVPFPLLSDADLRVHEAYRVVNALDDAGVKRLKDFGLDIERWSKRKHHKLAIPSVFLIDKSSVVRFAHAAHDYKTRPTVEQILTALRKLDAAPD